MPIEYSADRSSSSVAAASGAAQVCPRVPARNMKGVPGVFRLALAVSLGAVAMGTMASAAPPVLARFPDFGFAPDPTKYQGRVFRLSQDYPKTKPEMEPAVQRILEIDFTKDWLKYIEAVRDYAFEGNIERPVSETFYLEDNKVRRWYHVPWQHYGPHGREGVHGLTKEGPVKPLVLGPTQPGSWQTYAVGFYNAPGGYLIGKVWADAGNPNPGVVQAEGFPIGTVVAKVLFTTAPVAEARFLSNPLEWSAYITPTFGASTPRNMDTVRFIQMDIMVRDPRADATGGWVFGTLVYNGKLARSNPWLNVVPVGIMWGNDPGVTSFPKGNAAPTQTLTNPDLKHTIINSASPDLPPMHLGWGLRLNGPVDNTMSSCQSCHSTAQYPQISALMPGMATDRGAALTPENPKWLRWFRDVPSATPFDAGAVSMDYSLQLAGSIQNFVAAKAAAQGGFYHDQFLETAQPVRSISAQRGLTP